MDFEKEVIQKSFQLPVLVDFWASWCRPCVSMLPILEEVASNRETDFIFVKIEVDEHLDLVKEYKVMGVPNCKLFYQGQVIGEFLGTKSSTELNSWLDESLIK